ncbi:MAG: NAD-dependent epimerase/dehydratase family protein [Deltaproteobacteria bacterium]|nr:NAD-dependent epimerase/dehydratase family protein [Deltaproteobacteria bacterium]
MKYLVTGPTGFMGPYLVRELLSAGHTCRCLVRPTSRRDMLDGPGVEFVEGDVTRAQTLRGVARGLDGVFHLATLGHMSNFAVAEDAFEAVNVRGTLNVMEEALRARVGRVVHCSSVAAMGICPESPADEETPCRPHHPYGRSKLRAEQEVLRMVSERGLPALIVRFSMVYGPGDPRDLLRLTRLAKKGLFPKVGSRPKLTPLIHVQDAVRGLILAMEKGRPGQVYLLTNERSEPFDEIRKILQGALGVRRPPLYVPERAALWGASFVEWAFGLLGKAPPVTRKNIESTLADRVFSIRKAKRELGFAPRIDVRQGLAETVRWYKEQGWV